MVALGRYRWILCLLVSAGCGSDSREYVLEGPWQLPADIAAETDSYNIKYDDGPAWDGGSNCLNTFTNGAQALSDELLDRFPQITDIGGYSCRANTADGSRQSIHGTGRALDVLVPKLGDQADNPMGDPIAHWLLLHAEELGVQLVIWDQSKWNGSRKAPKHSAYGGPHPHDDHLHVELNLAGSE